MESIIIIIPAIVCALLLMPVHIYNYIYVNTEDGYASLNISAYRYLKIQNVNTVKNKPGILDINGKTQQADFSSFFKIAKISKNKIFIDKIVQLTDYGMLNENNAYVAVTQNAASNIFYAILKYFPKIKLKNYKLFNNAHSSIRYYAKAVTVVNVLTVIQIAIILLMEKLK